MNTKHFWFGLILLIIASLTTLLALLSHHQIHQVKKTQDKQADAMFTHLSYSQYDKNGKLTHQLWAPQGKHYNFHNRIQLLKPSIKLKTKQAIIWNISAQHGISSHNGQRIELWGQVRIHQVANANNLPLTILTSRVTYYPHKSYAFTQQNVTIIRPGSTLKAKGLEAYFKKGIVKSLSHSRGIYEPTQKNHQNSR